MAGSSSLTHTVDLLHGAVAPDFCDRLHGGQFVNLDCSVIAAYKQALVP
jgi:hypothetical protein